MEMTLNRKLQLCFAMVDSAYPFPRNRVWLDNQRLIATNGTQVLAFDLSNEEADSPTLDFAQTLDQGAKEHRQLTGKDTHAKTPEQVRDWLFRDAESRKVNLMDLLAFLRADEYLKCPHCSGSGRRSVNENDEEGWTPDPFDKARVTDFAGALINGNHLLEILAHLPATEYVMLSVWPQPGKDPANGEACDGWMLRIVGDRWTLAQAGMMQVYKDEVEVFEFAEAVK